MNTQEKAMVRNVANKLMVSPSLEVVLAKALGMDNLLTNICKNFGIRRQDDIYDCIAIRLKTLSSLMTLLKLPSVSSIYDAVRQTIAEKEQYKEDWNELQNILDAYKNVLRAHHISERAPGHVDTDLTIREREQARAEAVRDAFKELVKELLGMKKD